MAWIKPSSYTALPPLFYSPTTPTAAPAPKLVIFNTALAQTLGIETEPDISILSGTTNTQTLSLAYAGHQFGHLTMLGDGRAHLLGEVIAPNGTSYDVQLKGSGATPYSRGGDGRAALAPMLREYIMSEALAALHIPTTRSLAVIETGEAVLRETTLAGAVLTRIAASHLRIGHFELAAATQDKSALAALADYAITRHNIEDNIELEDYLGLLRTTMARQISLIIEWLRVGFIHGVMNTDNTTISGETIDYGPCAFLDEYDSDKVFSSIDEGGRYAYGRQPDILKWNLARFAETLLPLLHDDIEHAAAIAQEVIETFDAHFTRDWTNMMRTKLGLTEAGEKDTQLIGALLTHLQTHEIDYTHFFRTLSPDSMPDNSALSEWHLQWKKRFYQNKQSPETALELMRLANPARIPRNHQVEAALAAATQGDLSPLHDLLAALAAPYETDSRYLKYEKPPSQTERIRYTFCGT